MKVKICTSAANEDMDYVVNQLKSFNDAHAKQKIHRQEIQLIGKDEAGQIVAGLEGNVTMGWLQILILWVDGSQRKNGLGRQLLLQAEEMARETGAHGAYVETTSFQAKPFYESCGYSEFAKLEDFPMGDVTFFLRKDISR